MVPAAKPLLNAAALVANAAKAATSTKDATAATGY